MILYYTNCESSCNIENITNSIFFISINVTSSISMILYYTNSLSTILRIVTNSIFFISMCHELYLYDSILHELSLYDSTNRWDRFQLHLHYQRFMVTNYISMILNYTNSLSMILRIVEIDFNSTSTTRTPGSIWKRRSGDLWSRTIFLWYDSTNRWDRFQLHLHYQNSWVDLEKKIWRFMVTNYISMILNYTNSLSMILRIVEIDFNS